MRVRYNGSGLFFYDQGQQDAASVDDSANIAEPASRLRGQRFRVQFTSSCCAKLSAVRT